MPGNLRQVHWLISDQKIQSDNADSTAISDTTLTFDITNSEIFDFGTVSDSAIAEFIVQGDPVLGGQAGFLAVGSDPVFSFRIEQWSDTEKLGFTHGGVADYRVSVAP